MKQSAVIFIEKATPASITEFHDILSNDLLSIKEKWSFEFKTFRFAVKNLPPQDPKLMHSITFTHRGNQTVIIKNKSAVVTSSPAADPPQQLTFNSCSTGAPESFDTILTTKLSNLWTQRQSIKGDFGSTFLTTDLIIRATNVFSYGGFKGLLIELECNDGASISDFEKRIERVRSHLYGISLREIKICRDVMDTTKPNFLCDLAYQYIKVLEI